MNFGLVGSIFALVGNILLLVKNKIALFRRGCNGVDFYVGPIDGAGAVILILGLLLAPWLCQLTHST